MFHPLYGGTCHLKKVTHWVLGEIISLQIPKINIVQEK